MKMLLGVLTFFAVVLSGCDKDTDKPVAPSAERVSSGERVGALDGAAGVESVVPSGASATVAALDSASAAVALDSAAVVDGAAVGSAVELAGASTAVSGAAKVATRTPEEARAALTAKGISSTDGAAFRSAAGSGNLEVVQLFVEAGMSVESADDESGWTALHEAAYAGHLSVVTYLVEYGANVNGADEDGYTVLMNASWRADNLPVIRYLVDQGANIWATAYDGKTARRVALTVGNTSVADYLKSLETTEEFILAAGAGNLLRVRLYVEWGIDKEGQAVVSIGGISRERTALHAAAAGGHIEVVKYLVGQGASVSSQDDEGDTPLDVALAARDAATEGTDARTRFSKVVDALDVKDESPDLVVSASVDDATPMADQSITLSATVRNRGSAGSASTTLTYYRSADETISTTDTVLGSTDAVDELDAEETSEHSRSLTAPSTADTYYYGVCVAVLTGESNSNNNCSAGVKVEVVVSPPDLVVQSASVNKNTPGPGDSITLSATVRNSGTGSSASTTLRYYRSSDATITSDDTEVGSSDAVGGLDASGTSAQSSGLTVPSTSGTHYFGACVDDVSGETDTDNNCSAGVSVTVSRKMYWTDVLTDKIQRANLDGSNVEDLITTGLERTLDIALDVASGKMYWTDYGTATTGKIQRANLDGSGVEDLITTETMGLDYPTPGQIYPVGIALDVASEKMYWIEGGWGFIHRANLDGSGVENLFVRRYGRLAFIALDVANEKMYWTQNPQNAVSKIHRANLDGSGVDTLISTGLNWPVGIALDLGSRKMYWINNSGDNTGVDKIQRASLDGSGVEDLITTGLGAPQGIALDLGSRKMYWTDLRTDKIQRANMDGTGVVETLVTVPGPHGIALDLR